ncbi:hypothetical protein P168DRAFT_305288 [Aspergillus campestris IBT 28561]|uniref:Tetratricopeptide SHNi-TPR domain-containing protein n=1 Tax=Aspergillus campestris (strain IBT 28561) TaxID=1392248 RepID=A0A2I1CZ70_ASPC2|nr:uncharacterized protein P168DRAFT_305288 [Aspergillus campestris IBT 28561]PKY02906.1 hypothetical protein P168DRAFT_305288 [Aspergillus campestris IBT 28561]
MAENIADAANVDISKNPVADESKQLAELVERARAKDAIKDFNGAAELYSEATELQAKLNGELSLDNADLLYSYGKALYNVAVSNSDVLGSKVAGEPQPQSTAAPTDHGSSSNSASRSKKAATTATASAQPGKPAPGGTDTQSGNSENKPFFQFTGDENFDDDSDSDVDEEGEEGAGAEEEEEEDDFANAFEVLDVARILFQKKLDSEEEQHGKGKTSDISPDQRHIKERLADTYDLQAEISLEAERFQDAVQDLRTTLSLRESLFPMEDPCVAECHYKLSLALEFASMNKGDGSEGEGDDHSKVDHEMRKEAATQMERAIESCKIRIDQEQRVLSSSESMDEDKVIAMKRKIDNVKEITADMEQRLVDLRRPPVSIKESDDQEEAMLKGLLGQIMGQSPSEQKNKLDAATKGANDLSAFVKRKPAAGQGSSQKRSVPEEGSEGATKKARADSK